MCDVPALPRELIVDILSRVPVKSLMRFRCASKTWYSLIFDPTLVKLHFQRSSKDTHILLRFVLSLNGELHTAAAPCSMLRLLDNPSSTVDDSLHQFNHSSSIIGACNGLVCFREKFVVGEFEEYHFRFWNPATRIMSRDSPPLRFRSSDYRTERYHVNCGFGFDDESDTYKVVAMLWDVISGKREVRVHCMGDTCWRNSLTCPVFATLGHSSGQFVSGSINWLALHGSSSDYGWEKWETVTSRQLSIFSYDLKNDTYRYLPMPECSFDAHLVDPCLGVLNGCLCLSHDHQSRIFGVWVMREFGVQNSWTLLLNVSYKHLQSNVFPAALKPLCMSQDEDIMLLADYGCAKFVLYNRGDNKTERSEDFNHNKYSFSSHDYVQSLVLPLPN